MAVGRLGPIFLLLLPLLLADLVRYVSSQPTAETVSLRRLSGDTNVTLQCRATAGALMRWKFNGIILPDENNANYTLSRGDGTLYDLNIRRLKDEHGGNYTCIKLPSTIVAAATVTVLIPPTSVEIVGYQQKRLIDVPYGASTVNLTCRVVGAKPAATLQWLKRGEVMVQDVGQQVEIQTGTYATTRELSIPQPRMELNKIPFTCLVQHEALTLRQRSMNVTFNFSIHYPPGEPQIIDFDGAVKRPGDLLSPTCLSYGGNPQPTVHWYRNGQAFFLTYTSNEERMTVSSKFSAIINSSDNDAVYRCEVSNAATPVPYRREIRLSVKFPPSSVKISGHEKAKAGERATLSCTSSSSNPAANIIWLSRAQVVNSGRTFDIVQSSNGGYTSVSNITVNLTREDNNAEYICQATNPDLGLTVTDRVQLEVHYPPNRITISGYNESSHVRYNTVQRMTCSTYGGRPIPELSWSKESATIASAAKASLHSEIATREVEFITKPDDNNVKYTCSASSSAMDSPMTSQVTLRVYFPPQNVTLRHEPDPIRAGSNVAFICNSGSSNPTSEITWMKNREPVTANSRTTQPAAFSGRSTESRYEMMAQASDNGVLIECKAWNLIIGEGTTDGRTLSVHHAPIYASGKYQAMVAVEVDGTVTANFTPSAKPFPTEYSWFKGAEKLVLGPVPGRARRDITRLNFYADGGVITFVNVTKADAGGYRVEAKNSEGSASFEFSLDVQFGASFVGAIQVIDLGSGAAKLSCEADANPQTANMVKFTGRAGYDMAARTTQTYANKKAELTIANVVKDDLGEFTCTASNGLGTPAVQTVSLLVPILPVIDRSLQFAKAAARNGEGSVRCFIVSHPRPIVTWRHKGAALDGTTGKYAMTIKDGSDRFSFEAVLVVSNVTKLDYGSYACSAQTARGTESNEVLLEGTSKPDPPYDLQIFNATSSSIKIAWKAGFNGGLEQSFKVRYKVSESSVKGYTYVDAYELPFEVKGLNPATAYELTVAASNVLGQSEFVSPTVISNTLADLSVKPVEAKEEDATLIIILSVAIVGVLFFILNAFLIVLFVRRRRKQKQLIEDSASQANTLELYGTLDGSVANGFDDSRSYTTYEKSVDYSEDLVKHYEDDTDESENDEEDSHKHPRYAPAPGTYLLDCTIPPPQPWAATTGTASAAKQGAAAYAPRFDPGEPSTGETSDNYAEKLRAAGKRMPHTKDTLQKLTCDVGSNQPPPLLSYAAAHPADLEAPAIPERNYTPQPANVARFSATDSRLQVPEQGRPTTGRRVTGQYI